jgi:hypothetical protein
MFENPLPLARCKVLKHLAKLPSIGDEYVGHSKNVAYKSIIKEYRHNGIGVCAHKCMVGSTALPIRRVAQLVLRQQDRLPGKLAAAPFGPTTIAARSSTDANVTMECLLKTGRPQTGSGPYTMAG